MKKMIHLFTVAVFVMSVSMAVAGDRGKLQPQAAGDKAAKNVNCCIKGKCSEAPGAPACEKAGGHVVKDCRGCK